MSTVCFEMTCYEKSFNLLLMDCLLINNLNLFDDFNFNEKQVIVNNVKNKDIIKSIAKRYDGFNFYYTDENSEEILNFFGLSIQDFIRTNSTLNYSLQYFNSIFNCHSDYLFHISEDCNIQNLNSKFIHDSIKLLESSDDYIIAMPNWGIDIYKGAVEESIKEDNGFYIASGFTDQVFLIKTKVFKQKIYNFHHIDSNRYPKYGGECFEKRIDSYMKCNNLYRAIHKNYYYIHGYYDNIIKGTK